METAATGPSDGRSAGKELLALVGRILMVIGLCLCAVWIVGRLHGVIGANAALAQMQQAPAQTELAAADPDVTDPDMTDWAEGRIKAFRESLNLQFDPPLAELRIPSTGLIVPVLSKTDEISLNRGVGWIGGTALPDAEGNVGVAGHRDGFFRDLKDVAPGDVIELRTASGTRQYFVEWTRVVEPREVGVLRPTEGPALTLVTCYPFYFVGHAPQRYIVRAVPGPAPMAERVRSNEWKQ